VFKYIFVVFLMSCSSQTPDQAFDLGVAKDTRTSKDTGKDSSTDVTTKDSGQDLGVKDANMGDGGKSDATSDVSMDVTTDLTMDADVSEPECEYPATRVWVAEEVQGDNMAPAFLSDIVDPVFGTTITRITNGGEYQHYSKTQPWNADASLIFMGNGRHVIVDATSFVVLNKPNSPTGERRWSTQEPDKMFHLGGTQFMTYSPSQDMDSLLYDFANEGCEVIRLGPWEGNLSIDDKKVAFACKVGADLKVIVYDIENASIQARRTFPGMWGDANLDWLSVSQSGKYVVMNWRNMGMRSYDAETMNDQKMLAGAGEHGDLCVDENGKDVYVQVICGGHPDRGEAGIMSYDVETGTKTTLLPNAYTCTGHISCRNYRRPGWAYVSSNYHHEAFAVKLDGSRKVQGFAHMHQKGGFEPFAVPSPDGCKMMFASDWAGQDAAYVSIKK